jgi:PAS domain S-box-containing protein
LNNNNSFHNILDIVKEFDTEITHLRFSPVICQALDFVRTRLGIEHTSIALLKKESEGFLLYQDCAQIKGIESGKRLPFEKTVLTEVINSTEPLYRPNIDEWLIEYEADKIFLEAGPRSDFLIPLVANEQCIGTLNAGSMKTDGIREETRFVLQLLAPRLAQVLQHAMYVDALEEGEKRYRDLITEHKKAENALLEGEKRYKILIDSVTDYTFTVEVQNGKAVSTKHGPGCIAVTGYSSEEYEADPYLWYRMVHEEDRESVIRHADSAMLDESVQSLEHRIIHKNGDVKWVRNTPVPRYDKEGKLIAYDGLIVDITERRKAEAALLESERKLQSLYNSMTELMALHEVVYDTSGKPVDYRILDCNPAFTQITGIQRDKAIGASASQLYGSGEAPYLDIYARVAETGEPTQFDTYFPPMKKHFSISVFSPGKGFFATVASDITDRKLVEEEHRKLQEQLQHSQKMEAVGLLAGGVAHDFNNILTAIIGYANIVKMKMKKEDPLKTHLDQILRSSERGAHLTQSLLAFSRKQLISPKPVDLNIVIRNVKKLLGRVITEDIELKVALDERHLIIMADSGQMEQILMNLATNAKDAMPHGGSLTIGTEIATIDEQFIRQHGFGDRGEYALLSVGDTGTGMDEKTRERIFEPFFTTKEVGRGTGLGLAMVYGAIKQNGGYITVLTEPGKGTTFNIYLPLIKTMLTKEKTSQIVELIEGGTETILIAEDDESLRGLAASVLKEFGYTVIEAKDGPDAIEKFNEHKGTVRLLILDVIMPRKNGKEVYDEIKKTFPDIRVLFVSGYTSEIVHKKGIIDLRLNFLSKPISPNQLLKQVRDILDETVKK